MFQRSKYSIAGPNRPKDPARSPVEAFFVDISIAFLVMVLVDTGLPLSIYGRHRGFPDISKGIPGAAADFLPIAQRPILLRSTKHRDGVNFMKPLLPLPA